MKLITKNNVEVEIKPYLNFGVVGLNLIDSMENEFYFEEELTEMIDLLGTLLARLEHLKAKE